MYRPERIQARPTPAVAASPAPPLPPPRPAATAATVSVTAAAAVASSSSKASASVNRGDNKQQTTTTTTAARASTATNVTIAAKPAAALTATTTPAAAAVNIRRCEHCKKRSVKYDDRYCTFKCAAGAAMKAAEKQAAMRTKERANFIVHIVEQQEMIAAAVRNGKSVKQADSMCRLQSTSVSGKQSAAGGAVEAEPSSSTPRPRPHTPPLPSNIACYDHGNKAALLLLSAIKAAESELIQASRWRQKLNATVEAEKKKAMEAGMRAEKRDSNTLPIGSSNGSAEHSQLSTAAVPPVIDLTGATQPSPAREQFRAAPPMGCGRSASSHSTFSEKPTTGSHVARSPQSSPAAALPPFDNDYNSPNTTHEGGGRFCAQKTGLAEQVSIERQWEAIGADTSYTSARAALASIASDTAATTLVPLLSRNALAPNPLTSGSASVSSACIHHLCIECQLSSTVADETLIQLPCCGVWVHQPCWCAEAHHCQ